MRPEVLPQKLFQKRQAQKSFYFIHVFLQENMDKVKILKKRAGQVLSPGSL